MKNVTIYTTPTCGYCKLAKQFFETNKVEYQEQDVSKDEEVAKKMVEKTGQMGVPVIIIEENGQEEVIVGFDLDALTNKLGL